MLASWSDRSGRRSPDPPDWIELAGFKSLRDPARVQLRDLTLLAGANSSGKSSVMQPLLMMKQTLEATHDPGALLLDGSHTHFSRPDEFLSHGKRKDERAEQFQVSFGPRTDALELRDRHGQVTDRRPSPAIRLGFRPASAHKMNYGLAPAIVSQRVGDRWVELSETMTATDFAHALAAWAPEHAKSFDTPGASFDVQVRAHRFLVRLMGTSTRNGSTHSHSLQPVDLHQTWLTSILHLPGLRGHRERHYTTAQINPNHTFIQVDGPFTPYVASLLAAWQDDKDPRLEQVNDHLSALGLTWKVHANRPSAAQIELTVGRTMRSQRGGAHDLVSIADVGFGVSQVLPIVVALAAAGSGQIVYVEQPELHLHPSAQYAMGGLLASTAARGVRVVVETHSRMVLRAIQTAVARPGGLNPKQVGLHWFLRDPNTGETQVKLADLDETGAFGDWPVDFADVEAAADDSWLRVAFGGGS